MIPYKDQQRNQTLKDIMNRVDDEVKAWTNPITYIIGLPVLGGIVLSAMFDGVAKKTHKVLKTLDF